MTQAAILVLEDGTVFEGESVGAPGLSVGEVVFNTAMTGYQEVLTDPSYARQMVTLTYPHIGNTGMTDQDNEASKVWSAGLIVRDVPRRPSNWRSQVSLQDWLIQRGVVAIAGIDTRKLTRILRENGAQNGALMAGDIDVEKALEAARKFPGLKGMDLAKVVTTEKTYTWTEGQLDLDANAFVSVPAKYKVVAYDFGVKTNILRMLAERGCEVTVVPAQTPAAEVLALKPDGVFLSNGPGDPEPCDYAIEAIKTFIDVKIPTFGICLGHQLLGLASGAQTMKMGHGHHGANHPVQDLDSGRVMITSQNHGFAIDEATLPATLRVTHRSLFDGTNQGVARTDVPAFSFQGHPEASPGPTDVGPLFDRFVVLMEQAKA
ncbi:TPA: glutamine-hydrolyzing carbamoyl-phosphate synthase small subunit [Stenotrophomonas maltophilia]|uniref:glutamine-hydrolyzing carbamoyl-phosphate synthase small subunit n=1 Tax=Stenotrophomonas maltophilia group sp. Smal13 TaxID=3377166 RepID=UPI0025565F22|nr:glutamine-hydrolyzing carbamoyl-phosphate synthase small subunit [Stenotrophomonas maltophilia]EKU9959053.1 glutamine-hydrolyzing carbamoyl-phosphate synthase small subunit [Stenotrophomonas maltophilia]EKU9961669.1 glutamine-hydrolyzing carbamoyl-phosphate synthase small subunit [Stenotrophomonas maltophilia]EKU9985541.1 glutamine-hydrolyzing carbamoyl-phosphate synthase small subunit [Stenotrophomonas maltophilia]EKU9988017.1 glutamine-hydrolyzing carbamoyl-phosphate synthase small subunit